MWNFIVTLLLAASIIVNAWSLAGVRLRVEVAEQRITALRERTSLHNEVLNELLPRVTEMAKRNKDG